MTTRYALAVCLLLCGASVQGQSARDTLNEEPNHERLTFVQHMRVFELNLPAGESTLDHSHQHDVATLVLEGGTMRTRNVGEDWSAERMRALGDAELTTYTGAPASHREENVGASPYRMLVVENLREGGTWSTRPPLVAEGTALRLEGRSFAVYDARLDAQTPQTSHRHQNATLVVLLSGAVVVEGGGGEQEFRLAETGRWFPSWGDDLSHTLTAVGPGDVHFACIEAR